MTLLALRATILIAALTPIAYGFSAWFAPRAVFRFTRVLSGVDVTPDPAFRYLMKPLGLYMLMFGLLFAWSALDPLGHPVVVLWGAATLFLRGAQRALLSRDLHALFGIPPARNLANCAFLFVVAGALVGLLAAARAG
jgi:hypothetical protein